MFKTISRSLTRSRNQKGFTLVELMVVVVILGILAALVVPTLSGQIDRARINRTVADMKTIQNALQLHFAENSAYPAALTALGPQGITTVPTDAWGEAFIYTPTGTPRLNAYTLTSHGPDEVSGGGDDIIRTQ
ncbi:MAG: prepilin-type N-terminal cleavage/methylation domain-containing protein [Syntrophomonadaceae bacterium]|nr:prepilin-type N-terminal cleavage/methylation domain-containing protein [Syntrophomonadaceae bacterium]